MTTTCFRKNLSKTKVFFADIYQQYVDIHHTKRQTESTLRSCIILNLKKLFKFVSQCSLVRYLKSGLCTVKNDLDICDLQLYSQVTNHFGNVIVKRADIRLQDLLARCHYILIPLV